MAVASSISSLTCSVSFLVTHFLFLEAVSQGGRGVIEEVGLRVIPATHLPRRVLLPTSERGLTLWQEAKGWMMLGPAGLEK